jgi:hypothetical protein
LVYISTLPGKRRYGYTILDLSNREVSGELHASAALPLRESHGAHLAFTKNEYQKKEKN